MNKTYLPYLGLCWACFCLSQHFWQEHHARLILPILVLNSSSLVRACISAGSVFHIVGAKVRKLLYPKLIWLDFGISRSKGFLYWCCEGLSVIRSFMYFEQIDILMYGLLQCGFMAYELELIIAFCVNRKPFLISHNATRHPGLFY